MDSFELLRIEEDKVVERWASASLPALVESIGALDIRFDATLLREPRLERVVLAPKAELSVNDHHGTVLRVESGSLKFALLAPGAAGSADYPDHAPVHPPANDDILEPGESVSIQPQRSFRIRNTGPEEASLVWLRVREVDSQTNPPATDDGDSANSGIEVSLLAGGTPIRSGQGPFTLVADRMVAPPGTSIPLHTTGEFELLLIESGIADIALQDRFVLAVTDHGALRTQKESFRLESGHGISAPLGVDLEYLTAGEEMTVLWVVTVE